MLISLKQLVGTKIVTNEDDLLDLTDQIWSLGDMNEIISQIDHKALDAFVMMNVIGNWKGDGWGGVLESYEFLPFIESALRTFKFDVMADHWYQLLSLFPINPCDAEVQKNFYDHQNFLINPRFTIKNETLKLIDPEIRKALSEKYQELLVLLDDEADKYWMYNASNQAGWGVVIDYIQKYSV